MSISCPKCDIPTSLFNIEADLYFDRCNLCSGMWLDHGELARISGSKEDFPGSLKSLDGVKTSLPCPKCSPVAHLYEVSFSPESEIIVDVCENCKGLWLDFKELQQVQEILRKHRISEKKKRLSTP